MKAIVTVVGKDQVGMVKTRIGLSAGISASFFYKDSK